MASDSANINSPEIIRRFRHQFVKFDEKCRLALGGVQGDVRKTQEWLRRDQLAHWKRQLRKREDMLALAKSEYIRADAATKYSRKESCYDERKAVEKAQRLRDEAEEKIALVKQWIQRLEEDTTNLLRPCISLSSLMDVLTPKALARLDKMLDGLDSYLRAAPPE